MKQRIKRLTVSLVLAILAIGVLFGGSVLAAGGFQDPADSGNNWGSWTDGTKTNWNNNSKTLHYYKVTDSTTYTSLAEPYYYSDRALGIAGNFAIVGFNSIHNNAHTNGNILTNNLYYGSNMGTNGIEGEVSYANTVQQAGETYASTDASYFSTGSGTTVSVMDNGGCFGINGTKMSKPKTIYQEQENGPAFIDVGAVKTQATQINQDLAKLQTTTGVTGDFSDQNNQSITVTDDSAANVYQLDLSQVKMGSGLAIGVKGFTKNSTGCLIINIDMSKASSNTLDNLPQILFYDGNTVLNNQERTTWEYGRVLLNFYNNSGSAEAVYNGSFNLNARTIASILAPNAAVSLNQNLDGSVIANDVVITAESHRNDFMGTLPLGGTITISGNKTWTGDSTSDRPDSITLTVQKKVGNDWVDVTPQPTVNWVKDDANNQWSYTIANLPKDGTYRVVETVPEGYTNANNTAEGVAGQGGNITGADFVNTKKVTTGNIKVKKVDAATPATVLKGAVFTIYTDEACTTTAGTMTTGDDGTGTSEALTAGTYYVKETTAPEGYDLNATRFTVTVTAGQTVEVKDGDQNAYVTDTKKVMTGNITLTKQVTLNGQTTTGTKVDGTYYFAVYDQSGTTRQTGIKAITITNGVSGTATFDALPYGQYKIYEMTGDGQDATPGTSVQDVSITEGNGVLVTLNAQTVNATLTNNKVDTPTPSKINIPVTKVWDDGDNISQIRPDSIKVSLLVNGSKVDSAELTAANNWSFTFTDIDASATVSVEEETVEGYTAEYSGSASGLTITNHLNSAAITFEKVDRVTGKGLVNAVYGLYRMEGKTQNPETDTKIGSYTTGSDGKVSISPLAYGSYYFKEEKAPEGYTVDPNPTEAVTLNAQSSVDHPKAVTTSDASIVLKVQKVVQGTAKGLSGAVLQIVDSSGNVVQDSQGNPLKWVSDGTVQTIDTATLTAGGQYQLVEVTAPDGYEVAAPITFKISEDENGSGTTDIYILQDQQWVLASDQLLTMTDVAKKNPQQPSTSVPTGPSVTSGTKKNSSTNAGTGVHSESNLPAAAMLIGLSGIIGFGAMVRNKKKNNG